MFPVMVKLIRRVVLQVTKLMERVEATFIKHFSNANRSKGMSILRPKAKRERHRVTFFMGNFYNLQHVVNVLWKDYTYIAHLEFALFVGKFSGFFSGCTAALIVALVLIARARNFIDHPGATQYMETMFPLYRYGRSLFSLLYCIGTSALRSSQPKEKSYPFQFVGRYDL